MINQPFLSSAFHSISGSSTFLQPPASPPFCAKCVLWWGGPLFFWDQFFPGVFCFFILKIMFIIFCVTVLLPFILPPSLLFHKHLPSPYGKYFMLPVQSSLSGYSTLLFFLVRGLTMLPYSCGREMWGLRIREAEDSRKLQQGEWAHFFQKQCKKNNKEIQMLPAHHTPPGKVGKARYGVTQVGQVWGRMGKSCCASQLLVASRQPIGLGLEHEPASAAGPWQHSCLRIQ